MVKTRISVQVFWARVFRVQARVFRVRGSDILPSHTSYIIGECIIKDIEYVLGGLEREARPDICADVVCKGGASTTRKHSVHSKH